MAEDNCIAAIIIIIMVIPLFNTASRLLCYLGDNSEKKKIKLNFKYYCDVLPTKAW